MATFTYDPQQVDNWSNRVISLINGDGDSINACMNRFGQQMSILVQDGVWTGDAAYKNFENFKDTYNAFVRFINSFGDAFKEKMRAVNTSVAELETVNLGENTNVSQYGNLSYSQLSDAAEQNIRTDIVRYDYGTISSIGSELTRIRESLDSVVENLNAQVRILNSGDNVWEGNLSEATKNDLLDVISSNYAVASENLNICIDNIAKAAENAASLDNAAA